LTMMIGMIEKAIVLIPARYESTRFPGKPLALIDDKPMVQHVYERSLIADGVEDVIVATDNKWIVEAVEAFGGNVQMTSPDHRSGTERVAEVASRIDADIVINVQGDEPLIDPRAIGQALTPLLKDPTIEMSTLKSAINDRSEASNPNVVKVVTDLSGFALYFSRAAIPFFRDSLHPGYTGTNRVFKHIGLYVYRNPFLQRFAQMEPTPLEKEESLEQLRALENGYRIMVVETEYTSPSVDTPEDLKRVKKILYEKGDSDKN